MTDVLPSRDERDWLPTDLDLGRLKWTTLLYYLHETNPANGLVRDKTDPAAPCSIAEGKPVAEDAGKGAEVQFAGVEAVGLDGPVGMGGKIAILQVADGDCLRRGSGAGRPGVRRFPA